ncbi:hypothetical protein LOY34_19705 [Pseudomonas sp. B21-009]|uniref:hypothetical protein n=1 Tax=Pseudomonas sp. B21-009 TaxID=2895470 RepID=UPI002160DBCA|nr:hypothetical protein [Pseudomonas sp. B21-009]UVM65525.1 hypothetical protein LOY34_19705 [Pseudomonas sp. B21-009]
MTARSLVLTGVGESALSKHAREWRLCPVYRGFLLEWLKRMNILKKTFAIRTSFDYISAPRQAELLEEKR